MLLLIFKPKQKKPGEEKDPYSGGVFRLYRRGLEFAMRWRSFLAENQGEL